MLLEGTSLYFWLIFLILILIYITKKISLVSIFKKARIKGTNALIPIKYRKDLTEALHLKNSIAYLSYIPIYGIRYRKIILETLLQGFGLNKEDYIYYILFPMYKYPELAFRNVKLIQNDYSLTETFVESENIISGKEKVENNREVNYSNTINYEPNMVSIDGAESQTKKTYQADEIEHYINQDMFEQADSVFTNQNLEPDKHKETIVEVKEETPKKEKSIITPLVNGDEKVCPKCGAKLASNAKTCFLCGTHLT